MERNTRSGAVLVMHMSDNSIYTAQALDGYLTQMEQSGQGIPVCDHDGGAGSRFGGG